MTIPSTNSQPEPVALKELAALLVKHYGLHDGLWDVSLEMQVSIGQLGLSAEKRLPGAMFAISRIGLAKALEVGANTVNAADVNPPAAAAHK